MVTSQAVGSFGKWMFNIWSFSRTQVMQLCELDYSHACCYSLFSAALGNSPNSSHSLASQSFKNAMIAVAVDLVRLIVYSLSFHHLLEISSLPLLGTALIAASGGVFLGMFFLKKITIKVIQKMIIILLYLLLWVSFNILLLKIPVC